eukprot:3934774-Rhodomonas_salina.1
MIACIFPTPVSISQFKVWARPNYDSLADNLNVTLYNTLPPDDPPTYATFDGPYFARLANQNLTSKPSSLE